MFIKGKKEKIGVTNIEEMGDSVGTGTVPPLPPPLPKSPPQYPDLYGKRRELAKVQILEREISFLEVSLKFIPTLIVPCIFFSFKTSNSHV